MPDIAARNLNRGSTHIIGVFANPLTHVTEGINESLLEGIAEVLHAGGYDVFFELSRASLGAVAAVLAIRRRDSDAGSRKAETVSELDRRRVPYVCVNERVGRPVANVLADDAMGMNRALEHLAQLGHRTHRLRQRPRRHTSVTTA